MVKIRHIRRRRKEEEKTKKRRGERRNQAQQCKLKIQQRQLKQDSQ
jgi:hypothetical protein